MSRTFGSEELPQRLGRIGALHQMLADQKGVEPGAPQPNQVFVSAQAGLADGDAIIGNLLDQFERSFEANLESCASRDCSRR